MAFLLFFIRCTEATMKKLSDIGVIGLAVMGENLALNISNSGFRVSVYNRTISKVDRFITGRGNQANISGFHSLEDFVDSLEPPRKIMMMLKAGKVIDDFIDKLIPLLKEGDIIIDGGNSNYETTRQRMEYVESQGLLFIGSGVSGGEEGALYGPSLMPGGSPRAWSQLEPIFMAISAKADDGSPCCVWLGDGGAGHFVKMVHNGIEYGDMQLICETYHIMKELLGMKPDEIHQVYKEWNNGELASYLIEITSDIFAYKDSDSEPLIDKILDTAGQKGTGKLAAISALHFGEPLSLIAESVTARFLSAAKEIREAAAKLLKGPEKRLNLSQEDILRSLAHGYYAARIISYTQGFNLMQSASREYTWRLPLAEVARIWRGGCIIRSALLDKISAAFINDPNLANLLLDAYFQEKIHAALPGLRKIVAMAAANGIPIPAHASGLNYYDGLRCMRLPANLLQAQRDYFGAHTYERLDRPRGEYFHTNWTGKGGDTTSTTYSG